MTYFKLPSIRVHLFGYLFSPRWIPTILTLFLLPFLISLGMWQLHRADQKKAIEQALYQHAKVFVMENLNELPLKSLQYQTLKVAAMPDNQHLIYLDNKIYHGRPGMQVLEPLRLPGEDRILLINRGFVYANSRNNLPTLHPIKPNANFLGLIMFPSKPFLLRAESWNGKWPMLVQGVDLTLLSKQLHAPLFPFILLQTSPKDPEFIQDWHPVNFPSYRHTGYAIQWFSLALTLVIIYLVVNTRIKRG